ncbi:N-acetylglucosamine-1-phosphotransferase subunits alpha/beta [Ixodes scapularis]|uniref:N-acetylglucosamine-1-phosphotransferase subunits alpha/beta n=1 Tax=Ixodes scapularis TaxID=6945 RepID=UPI001C38C5F0|nr:N-acetylglucosamine-1-phosphotransferase subunits alpha/beta [Ixodes scapularis]
MRRAILCKLLQRQTYNVLSQRHLFIVSLVGLIIFLVSAFRFCEVALDWSKGKYAEVFSRFSDNIAGQSFQDRLCQHVPIDAVYTWVNGSDLELVRNLSAIRKQLALETNKSSSPACQYKMCVPAPIVVLRHLSNETSLVDVQGRGVRKVFKVNHKHKNELHTSTVLLYSSLEEAQRAATNGYVLLADERVPVGATFVTTDSTAPNTAPLEDMLMIVGVPSGVSETDIAQKLSGTSQETIVKIHLYQNESLALLVTSGKAATDALSKANVSLKSRLASISRVFLVLEPLTENEDVIASRFADNDELKYSLRSLQKHAPWVRRVFVVTNGQIPSWLNLDNPRITIVTHEEIFRNLSHLPTYSSPAIETHLHCIPGLSQRFIYLNDDVMFGKEVWPEDFYTHTGGYKVRLAWPVPDCAMGCPTSWVRDGYCDKACNNTQCEWDGGDCIGGGAVTLRPRNIFSFPRPDISRMYCSSSCANSWLADKYCDQACNVLPCAFDAGDCGTGSYYLLHGLTLSRDERNYTLPPGKLSGYFNLSGFMDNGTKITEAFYEENAAVRAVAISMPTSVMTVLLFPHHNVTQIQLTLKGVHSEAPFEFQFTLSANTSSTDQDQEVVRKASTAASSVVQSTTPEEMIDFTEYPLSLRYPPQPQLVPDEAISYKYSDLDVDESELPSELVERIKHTETLYSSGLLTLKGFRKKKSQLVEQHLKNTTSSGAVEPKLIFRREEATVAMEHAAPEAAHGQRSLLALRDGTLPWEKQGFFGVPKELRPLESWTWRRRRLLDTFGDSLRHVNRLFNSAFGYEARKVPSHMAHMVDVDVVRRLQDMFPEEFDRTSSHKVRSSGDMQFAFSYFYFLMSERRDIEPEEIFDAFDVDSSGTWSDREIRTVITHLFDLPVEHSNVQMVEGVLTECAHNFTPKVVRSTPSYERYLESSLPTITKETVVNCSRMITLLRKVFKTKKVNQFEMIKEEDYAFKMIDNNASRVLAQLDGLRRDLKKFICLNDNIDHASKDSDLVKAVVHDFYESLFPTPSQFELPPEYRNRFLHVRDLHEWRAQRSLVQAVTYVAFGLLVGLTVMAFCSSASRNGRKVRRPDDTSSVV